MGFAKGYYCFKGDLLIMVLFVGIVAIAIIAAVVVSAVTSAVSGVIAAEEDEEE